uniref:Major facilitator superfamily (MFS) profile domain-containing protein n=1 Tax=Panagrolaimus sp. PS1159 TaxID=55785 RepID=A0AC35F0G3_9BILA
MDVGWKLLIRSSLIALSANINYAYSTTYLNVPIDYFKSYLEHCFNKKGLEFSDANYNLTWNLLLHVWFIGYFIGIWLSPIFNERFGRRTTFIVFSGINFLTSIGRYGALEFSSMEALFISRILASVACAVIYQTQILFLQECASAKDRGTSSFLSGIWFAIVALFSIIVGTDKLLGKRMDIAYFFAFLAAFVFHETPKYLILSRKDRKEAKISITFYQGKTVDINKVLAEIEAESVTNDSDTMKINIFKVPYIRKAILLSVLALQNTVAFWSILLSSTYFLKDAGVENDIAEYSTTLMAVSYVLGTCGGIFWIQKYSRRRTLFTTTVINVGSLAFYAICAELTKHIVFFRYGCLLSLVIYGFSYGAGAGPTSRFISGELVAQNVRSKVQACTVSINQIVVIASTFAILPLFKVIHAWSFVVLFVIPSIGSLIILFWKLPETKNRPIEDIVKELSNPKS